MNVEVPVNIQDQYDAFLSDSKALNLQQKIVRGDARVWSESDEVQATIGNRLGWIHCLDSMLEQVTEINAFCKHVHELGYRHCVLLGMGGSSLAPEAFSELFGSADTGIENKHKITLEVLDNTSPDAVMRVAEALDWRSTLFIIASKSGTTLESDSLYRYFYQQVSVHNPENPGQQFVAITDPETVLSALAKDKNFLKCFINPADIGGRFSVLSLFGLVPAALVGVDIRQMLESAVAERRLISDDALEVSQSTRLGVLMGLAAQAGVDKLVITLNTAFKPFASWLEQLVAESTGKLGKGVLPVINVLDDNRSTTHSHHLAISFAGSREDHAQVSAQSFELKDLGAEFFKWEWATAVAGAVMNINPFDEPNVSENKQVTNEVLDTERDVIFSQLAVNDDISLVFDGSDDSKILLANRISQILSGADKSDYLAILAYTTRADTFSRIVDPFRQRVEDQHNLFTTFGVGPRYLHSTGQLHKGGTNNGIFVLITTDYDETVEIPGSDYSFNELNSAQALGDKKVLVARQRRLIHVHLPNTDEHLLTQLGQALSKA